MTTVLPALTAAAGSAQAEEASGTTPKLFASILRDPSNLQFYDTPITHENLWMLRLHGVRNAPLDPRVWGARREHRTDSHRMVPIKPFYLRSSERPDYRLDRIVMEFQFRPATPAEILASPHEKDAVVDVGFAGEIIPQPGGKEPLRERGYVLRLSGYPYLKSGLYYRSRFRHRLLNELKVLELKSRARHTLECFFTDDGAAFRLDGKQFAELKGELVNRGLISLVSSWHPVDILRLQIDGHSAENPAQRYSESGVIAIPKKLPKQRPGETVPGGNEILDKALLRTQQEFESSK